MGSGLGVVLLSDGSRLGEILLTELQVIYLQWFALIDPQNGQSPTDHLLLRKLRHRRDPSLGQSHCQGATESKAS